MVYLRCLRAGSSSGKKAVGLAFNYVAGEEGKMADATKALRNTSPVPVAAHGATTPVSPAKGRTDINPASMDYVESAALKSKPAVPLAAPVGTASAAKGAAMPVAAAVVVSAAAAKTPDASGKSRGHKRNRSGHESSDGEDGASLEEYEEDKQPQTEEIMNAQLVAKVRISGSRRSTNSSH